MGHGFKTLSSTPVRGGKGKMFAKTGADPQVPGQTAAAWKAGAGPKFASGGKTKMFGKQSANPAKPR